MKKCLKKQINKLQSDNNLMQKIIADSPRMQKLYDLYNRPLNITHTTIPILEFKAEKMVPAYMANDKESIELTKQLIAEDLLDGIKENITYEIGDTGHGAASITGSIFIGRKDR